MRLVVKGHGLEISQYYEMWNDVTPTTYKAMWSQRVNDNHKRLAVDFKGLVQTCMLSAYFSKRGF